MYEHMAGIVPTSAGYATVDVKPQISKTLGPSSVNAAVKTVPTAANNSTTISEQIGGVPPKRNRSIVHVHVNLTSALLFSPEVDYSDLLMVGLGTWHCNQQLDPSHYRDRRRGRHEGAEPACPNPKWHSGCDRACPFARTQSRRGALGASKQYADARDSGTLARRIVDIRGWAGFV